MAVPTHAGLKASQTPPVLHLLVLAPCPLVLARTRHAPGPSPRNADLTPAHVTSTFAQHRFVQNTLTLAQGLPLLRTLKFGWRPEIGPVDVAGILNANVLYSFTLGVTQLGFAIYFFTAAVFFSPAACDEESGAKVLAPCGPSGVEGATVLACAVLAASSIVLALLSSQFDLAHWLQRMQAERVERAAARESLEHETRKVHALLMATKQQAHTSHVSLFAAQLHRYEQPEDDWSDEDHHPVVLESLAEQLLVLERGYGNALHGYEQYAEGILQLMRIYDEQARESLSAKDQQMMEALRRYRQIWVEKAADKETEWLAEAQSYTLGSFSPPAGVPPRAPPAPAPRDATAIGWAMSTSTSACDLIA